MQKILLVNPDRKLARLASDLPLGLCYLSSMLKKNGYNSIIGIDLQKDSESLFEKHLKDSDIVGIHVVSKIFTEALRLAEKAKQINPKIKVVFGGPHPTLEPRECIEQKPVDFVVRGEGEYSFLEIVKAVESSGNFSDIRGIFYKENGEIRENPPREWLKNLDELPFPDRELFNINKYKPYMFFPPFIPMVAGRSCPYVCTNCQPALREIAGPYRVRSAENVIAEMKEIIKKYGIRNFWFNDNDVTIRKDWIVDFCNKLIIEKMKIKWGASGRANILDKELMKLMKDAGCVTIHFGFEHGSQEVLDNLLDKKINVNRAKEVIKEANEIGLRVHCWYMFGVPGSTKEQEIESINVAKKLTCNSIMLQAVQPQPHIKLKETSKEKGWLIGHDYCNLDEQHSFFKTENWGPEFVDELRERIMTEFDREGWSTDGSLIFRNIVIEVKQDFFLYVGREFLSFLKDRNTNHLRWMAKAFKFKIFGVPVSVKEGSSLINKNNSDSYKTKEAIKNDATDKEIP